MKRVSIHAVAEPAAHVRQRRLPVIFRVVPGAVLRGGRALALSVRPAGQAFTIRRENKHIRGAKTDGPPVAKRVDATPLRFLRLLRFGTRFDFLHPALHFALFRVGARPALSNETCFTFFRIAFPETLPSESLFFRFRNGSPIAAATLLVSSEMRSVLARRS